MSGYEIKVSVTALCPCCGEELPSNAYTTRARPSEGVFDRDNPSERTDRRVFITPCATCFVPRAAVAELIEADAAYDLAMATRHSRAYLACAPIKQRRIQERLLSACKRRSAALSRVRGSE